MYLFFVIVFLTNKPGEKKYMEKKNQKTNKQIDKYYQY